MSTPAAELEPEYDGKSCFRKTLSFIHLYWQSIVMILWPVMTLPFLIHYWEYKEVRCAYVITLMAIYWMTIAVPIGIAAVLPVALFPPMGILTTEEICRCYMNDTIFVFISGLVVALAVEHSNLHMRVALWIMTCVGCSHKRLLGGFLLVISLLSMWVSNTATTAMMIPIILAVLTELEKEGIGKVYNYTGDSKREATRVTRGYLLACAYGSSISGTVTIIGTGTNLTFRGLFEAKFENYEGVSFAKWMMYSAVQAYVILFLTWLYIQIAYFGMLRPKSNAAKESFIGPEGEAIAKRVMTEKYNLLGPMTFHEKAVSLMFMIVVFLWFTRNPGFIDGWYQYLKELKDKKDTKHETRTHDTILDSTPVILVTILMFIIPREPQFLHMFSKDASKRPLKPTEGLITWEMIEKKVPWNMMFLIGGGFAISTGGNKSGLSDAIGNSLSALKVLDPTAILWLLCFFISFFTEFTSNVGIANLILPVIMELCLHININPLYLCVPATLMCSYGFRLPASTPPNALVTLNADMPVKHLMIGGCLPSIYSVIIVIITFSTWGVYVYDVDFDKMPDWAFANSTI